MLGIKSLQSYYLLNEHSFKTTDRLSFLEFMIASKRNVGRQRLSTMYNRSPKQRQAPRVGPILQSFKNNPGNWMYLFLRRFSLRLCLWDVVLIGPLLGGLLGRPLVIHPHSIIEVLTVELPLCPFSLVFRSEKSRLIIRRDTLYPLLSLHVDIAVLDRGMRIPRTTHRCSEVVSLL